MRFLGVLISGGGGHFFQTRNIIKVRVSETERKINMHMQDVIKDQFFWGDDSTYDDAYNDDGDGVNDFSR